jgi:hypothetical protein
MADIFVESGSEDECVIVEAPKDTKKREQRLKLVKNLIEGFINDKELLDDTGLKKKKRVMPKKERTPEQVVADKEKMARLREMSRVSRAAKKELSDATREKKKELDIEDLEKVLEIKRGPKKMIQKPEPKQPPEATAPAPPKETTPAPPPTVMSPPVEKPTKGPLYRSSKFKDLPKAV